MALRTEYRAFWFIDGGPEQNGSWVEQKLIAQVELEAAEQAAQPYTTFEGDLEVRQVGV